MHASSAEALSVQSCQFRAATRALQRGADALLSNNERDFIAKALRGEQRIDGRGPFDYRPVTFQFSLDDSSCTVHLGQTRVRLRRRALYEELRTQGKVKGLAAFVGQKWSRYDDNHGCLGRTGLTVATAVTAAAAVVVGSPEA